MDFRISIKLGSNYYKYNYNEDDNIMKQVSILKNTALKYAGDSADAEFELPHLKHVVKYSKKLAKLRDLDKNLALIIAYGHDLGRTMKGYTGKRHAQAGAETVADILRKDGNLSDKKIKVVSKAILTHSKKKNIGSKYSELIKDADSLAHHKEDLIAEENWAELYRVKACKIKDISVETAPISAWYDNWKNNLSFLAENPDSTDAYSPSWVHKKRVAIRQLKIINWYFIKLNKNNKKILKELNTILNIYFKSLENPRKYFVLKKVLTDLDQDSKALDIKLEEDLNSSTKEIRIILSDNTIIDKLNDILKRADEEITLPSDKAISKYNKDRIWTKKLKKFIDIVSSSGTGSIDDLHHARIQGKRFKYMADLKLISISSKYLYKSIVHFHKTIGALHDIDDLYKYTADHESADFNFKTSKSQRASLEADLYEKCKRTVFFFRLLSRSI